MVFVKNARLVYCFYLNHLPNAFRYRLNGKEVDVVCTDDCCGDRGLFEELFPHLRVHLLAYGYTQQVVFDRFVHVGVCREDTCVFFS